jgi:hypothetical protein
MLIMFVVGKRFAGGAIFDLGRALFGGGKSGFAELSAGHAYFDCWDDSKPVKSVLC